MSEPKERPIIFSGEMIVAILKGSKTQTRRVIKPQPTGWAPEIESDGVTWAWCIYGDMDYSERIRCPYGAVGDKLWVRESMRENDEGIWCYAADHEWVGVDREDEAQMMSWVLHKESSTCPSIHMPRWASRITLEVTGVRAERIFDISQEDAMAEGVSIEATRTLTHRGAFAITWDAINKKRGYGWEGGSNPWVWVIEFKKVTND